MQNITNKRPKGSWSLCVVLELCEGWGQGVDPHVLHFFFLVFFFYSILFFTFCQKFPLLNVTLKLTFPLVTDWFSNRFKTKFANFHFTLNPLLNDLSNFKVQPFWQQLRWQTTPTNNNYNHKNNIRPTIEKPHATTRMKASSSSRPKWARIRADLALKISRKRKNKSVALKTT